VMGSSSGSISTAARTLAGTVGPGTYTFSILAVNPCGTGPGTTPRTVVVP
jgi:hypothetical protein